MQLATLDEKFHEFSPPSLFFLASRFTFFFHMTWYSMKNCKRDCVSIFIRYSIARKIVTWLQIGFLCFLTFHLVIPLSPLKKFNWKESPTSQLKFPCFSIIDDRVFFRSRGWFVIVDRRYWTFHFQNDEIVTTILILHHKLKHHFDCLLNICIHKSPGFLFFYTWRFTTRESLKWKSTFWKMLKFFSTKKLVAFEMSFFLNCWMNLTFEDARLCNFVRSVAFFGGRWEGGGFLWWFLVTPSTESCLSNGARWFCFVHRLIMKINLIFSTCISWNYLVPVIF